MKKLIFIFLLFGTVCFGQTPLTTTRLTTDTVRMRKLTQLPTHPPTGFKMTDWINDLWLTDSVTHRKVLTDVITTAMKEPTGFLNNTSSHLSFTNHNRTLIISGSAYTTYYRGTPTVHSGDTIQIANTTGLHYIYYNSAGTLVETTVFPGFDQVLVAHVYWNASTGKGLLNWERHGITMDWATHQYLHHTVGSRYENGFGATFGNTTFSIGAGDWHDEDIEHLDALGTTATILYKNGSADYQWDTLQTNYMKLNGANIRYNNGTALADVGANAYVAYWIFVTSDSTMPFVSLMGQRTDVTLADARTNNTYESLVLGTLPYVEMKLLYRVLLRNDATPYEEVKDYRNTSAVGNSNYLATSHTNLSGLTADDHVNYAYLPGRATNQIYNGTNVANGDLTVQGTSDTTRATSYVNLQPYGGGVNIGTQTGATGYTLNNAGFYNSATTVNQSTYPTINASQTAQTLQDGSAFTGTDVTMSTLYQAVKFTASAAHTMGDFQIRIKESADITNTTRTLTGYIYTDNSGVPGTLLEIGKAMSFSEITSTYQVFSVGTTYTLTAGVDYWLVIRQSAAPTGGNIILDSDVSADMGATSANGSAWTKTTARLRYVIRGVTYYGINALSTNNHGIYSTSTNGYGIYGASTNSYGIYGRSTSNIGIYGISTTNVGIYGASTSNIGTYGISTTSVGIYGASTSSYGFYSTSTSGIACGAVINPSSTNTTAEIMRLQRTTSGTAAANIGGSMDWYVEDAAGTAELSGRQSVLLTTATNGAETSAMTWWTRTGGASIAENMRLDGNGSLGLGVTPTATLHLKAGTATIAPIKLTTGTPLATTEAGAMEFDNSHLWFTVANGGARYQLDQQAGTGANTALSNLASVAINLTLDPGTDNTLSLGSSGKTWSDLWLGSGSIINWAASDLTLRHASDSLILSGGYLSIPIIKITGGNPGLGKVLTSDADGDATWQVPATQIDSTRLAYLDKENIFTVPQRVRDTLITRTILPQITDSFKLGDEDHRWKYLFLKSNSVIDFGDGTNNIASTASGLSTKKRFELKDDLTVYSTEAGKTNYQVFINTVDADNMKIMAYEYGSGAKPLYIGGLADATSGLKFDANATNATLTSTGLTVPLIKLTGGTPGLGKVLTSDADGNGNWETPSIANLYLGASDTYAGVDAMTHNAEANAGVAIGMGSLHKNTTGNSNVGVGVNVLHENETSNQNAGFGSAALYNTIAESNTGLGCGSGATNTTGIGNLFAGNNASSSSGAFTGSYNTFLGYHASYPLGQKVDAENSTALGANSYTTKSNQMVYGDANIVENVFKGNMVHPPKSTSTVTAGTGITAAMTSRIIKYTGAAAVDITANPQIADGEDGTIITIVGTSDTNTLKLDDGTGLQLAGGASMTLGIGDTITLTYIASLDLWIEISRSDN